MQHPLRSLAQDRRNGVIRGICSLCSASELVLEAAIERAAQTGDLVLIEATANQVNQFGGYTGMKPTDFHAFVMEIADRKCFPRDRVLLGGDHLGPLVWCREAEADAMAKSDELVRQFVLAGFTKIHLDTSMRLAGDDPEAPLSDVVIAARGARLAAVCERAWQELRSADPDAQAPVYVIGSEVPIPGGAQEAEEGIRVTDPADFARTVEVFRDTFSRLGLEAAWKRVIAVVVQPGVEFGDDAIHEYDRKAASALTAALSAYPGLVFEGHSTDYQTPEALRAMVEDGIAILKVGPALTFALREALFDLTMIENELLRGRPDIVPSRFVDVLEAAMVKSPGNWAKHYHGTEDRLQLARKFSLSDRCRYYLPDPHVANAMKRLFENLDGIGVPLSLLSQYMPIQYSKVRAGRIKPLAAELAKDRVVNCIDEYLFGTKGPADANRAG